MAKSWKRSRVERYFRTRHRSGGWLIAGVLGLVFWIAAPQISALVPLQDNARQMQSALAPAAAALLCLACLVLVGRWALVPSDRTIDKWADQDWSAIGERARHKFSLDAEELIHDPITFFYYSFDNAQSQRGRDNRWRTTQLAGTVINSTRQQFMIYICLIDLRTGNFAYEEAHMVFYQDVVSLSTVVGSRTVEMRSATKEERKFARKNPGAVVNKLLHINDVESVEMRLVNGGRVPLAVYRNGRAISTEGDLSQLAPDADVIDRLRKLVSDMRAHAIDPEGRLASARP